MEIRLLGVVEASHDGHAVPLGGAKPRALLAILALHANTPVSAYRLIEGLWGYLKRSALNNYFFGDIASLEEAIHDAFRTLQRHPETALSLAYRTATNLRNSA